MMSYKPTMLLLALALTIAGCGDGADSTTSATDATTTTSEDATATSEDVETVDLPAMLYVPSLVVVDERSGPNAVAALDGKASAIDAIAAYEALTALGEFDGYQADLVNQIDGMVDFLSTSENPLEIAIELEENGINAAPVSAIGFVGHWGFQPGSDPKLVDPQLQEEFYSELGIEIVEAADLSGYVGVVDSGIANDLPDWMDQGLVIFDPEDTEIVNPAAGEASHGTFVTDLIRRIAPKYGVSLAKAQVIPGPNYAVWPEGHPKPEFSVSNELDVAYAVVRLMNRTLPNQKQYAALNLSLGAYIADPAQPDLQLVLLQNVLGHWAGGPVIAAAGNEDLTLLHWPAALPNVVSVAAGDLSQAPVPALPPGATQWFNLVAPGVHLVGLAGDGETLVSWSGSSFATAVASAMNAGGANPTADYNMVPRLSYLDGSGNLVVNP